MLEKYLGKGTTSGGPEAAFQCPVCKDSRKDKKKLIVRFDGWYHCWICGLSGKSFFTLLKKVAPQSLKDPSLEGLVERKLQDLNSSEEETPTKVDLPEELYLVASDESYDPDIMAVRKYLEGRGLTKSDMFRWRISATKSGNFKRKAIIPSFDPDGEPNYFIARSIDDGKFKYQNCKRPKVEVVFNDIDIDWSMPVTLVEGVFDAIKCPENTVPVLGSSLPKESELFRKLWQNNCKVTVAFDPDLKDKSHRVCSDLSKAGLEVLQVWAPDGKDFGAMKKDEVSAILKTARPWAKEERLFFKIRNISSGSLF